MTPEENKMSKLLRHRSLDDFIFYRHHRIGEYIVDFVCEKEKLIIDIFYGQYTSVNEMEEDKIRLNYLKEKGYEILRIMDKELLYDFGGVYYKIIAELNLLPEKDPDSIIDFTNYRYQNFLKAIEEENFYSQD